MRTLFTAAISIALWLLMSGIYKPMVISFGLASVIFVLYVTGRMNRIDEDRLDIRLKPIAFLGYMVWLMGEIVKANVAVTKIILSTGMPLRQHLFSAKYTQESDLAQVVFANSITLTPGTITVETEAGHFLVHAIDYSADNNLALADMDRRVTATERGAGA